MRRRRFALPWPDLGKPRLAFLVSAACLLAWRLPADSSAAIDRSAPTGVVVEEVSPGSALERAGLRAGDLLLSWRRPPGGSESRQSAGGDFDSIFRWRWFEVEQAPRGTIELEGQRNGESRSFEVTPGWWGARLRPAMSDAAFRVYSQGRERLESEDLEAATGSWRRLAESLEPEVSWHLRCWILLRSGETWSEAREWEKAETAYHSAFETARGPLSQVAAWRALGDAHKKQNDFQQARKAYDTARRIRQESWGESLALSESLHDLGRLTRRLGELDSARGYHEHALAIRRKLAPDSLAVAASLYGLGAVLYKSGELQGATDHYQRALAIRRKLAPESLDLAATLGGLGSVAYDSGELERAADYFLRALKIKRRLAPRSLTVANSLLGLGSVAFERGEQERAADYYQRALAIRQELAPGSLAVASSLVGLGTVAARRGELDSAADLYRRGLEIYQNLAPRSVHTAFTLNNLGLLASHRGELERATDFFHRSLAIHQELAPGSLWTAYTLNDLARIAQERGELERAADDYRRALEIEEKLAPRSLLVAFTLHGLGEAASKRGELDQAADYLDRALEIRRQLAPASSLEAETRHALGVLHRQRGQPRLAADAFLASIEALEEQVGKLGGSHDVQAGFRARFGRYYRDHIVELLDLAEPEEAFHTLERSRARSFLALLAERDTVFSADVPEELDGDRRRIAANYDRTQQQISERSPDEHAQEIEDLLGELRRLRREYDAVAAEIRRASPRLAALRYPQPLKLRQVVEVLDPGTVMLSYSVGKKRTDLFAVTGDGLRVETLPIGEEKLGREVELLRHRIAAARSPRSSFGASHLGPGKRLYATLIEPVADLVQGSDRLLVVPDGPLHVLPWSALIRPAPESAEGSDRDWQYLAEWKSLHTALSGTVYAELKRGRAASGGGRDPAGRTVLAAFGDPLYPDLGEGAGARQADVAVRAATRHFDFRPLPGTRREVERIAALYGRGAATYLGAEATEERAKAVGEGPRYVHFAAHGLLDERFPLNSAVVLSLREQLTEGRDNGLLQVWEIFERLRLDAELVVLSACQTAGGKHLSGEGLIGLTRAFQYAGARSVAASLWSVDDPTTSELMVRFYRHLKAGKPKDEALRAAQIELVRGPIEVEKSGKLVAKDASAPYYWAAFQIYGDWR